MNNHNNIMSTSEYIFKPNLPNKKVKTVIIDFRVPEDIINVFKENGVEVIKTKKLDCLYDSVIGHPDMQIHHLGKNEFICEPTVYDYYTENLKNAIIYKGKTYLKGEYPFDIAYNVLVVGNFVFHNLKYTNPEILEYYKSHNYKLIDVKQGYTKCSALVVDENSIITSDKLIAKNATENGLDALFVDAGDIKLKCMSNGLAGGIGGKIDKNILAIYGDINKLKTSSEILEFCAARSVKILPLNKEIPEDFGSIIPIL